MDAVVWSDYLCPWCYAGLDRTALLEQLGIAVSPRPFELHPEIPAEGWSLASGWGRRLFDRIAAECDSVGLAFRRPERVPNSRRALLVSEWIRTHEPAVHPRVHRALFDAVFALGLDIGNPAVLATIVAEAGGDAGAASAAIDAGEMDGVLEASREEALDHGITGTPAWLIDGRLLIAGLQPREYFERMIARLRRRGVGD